MSQSVIVLSFCPEVTSFVQGLMDRQDTDVLEPICCKERQQSIVKKYNLNHFEGELSNWLNNNLPVMFAN